MPYFFFPFLNGTFGKTWPPNIGPVEAGDGGPARHGMALARCLKIDV